MLDKVSNMFFLFGLIGMTNLDFTEFKLECPVMKFESSKLIGPESKSFNHIDVNVEFPGTEYIDFDSKKLPVLPAEHIQAVDLWSIVKSAEVYPLSSNIEYTVTGIDPNIICSPLLFGQNERLARRVNNMGTVLTLLYNVFDCGFNDISSKIQNHIELAERMSPFIKQIGEDKLFKFRKDSYYDAVSFHQFLAQGLIVYMETCRRNNIPCHDKLEKNHFGKVQHKSTTIPNSSSLNALTNCRAIDGETLIYSFILSYLPRLGDKKTELNSVTLRRTLKQILQRPGDTIKIVIPLMVEQGLIETNELKSKKRWKIKDYLPTEANRKLLKKVYFDTAYEAYESMAARYTNLQHHLPTLECYFNNVIAANPNSILISMGYHSFTKYCKGNISWVQATESNKLKAIFYCCEFLTEIELENLRLTCSFFCKKIIIQNDDGDIQMK